MSVKKLEKGQWVVFSIASGNDRIDPSIHQIESSEEHNGQTFYRLFGMPGSLFLRSSLATTRRMHIPASPEATNGDK